MRGHDVVIRYGDGTEQTLPSVPAAVMHLNISASNRKKRMLMQGLSQQGESHQSSWSQTQSSVTILPSMKYAQIIDFYIF